MIFDIMGIIKNRILIGQRKYDRNIKGIFSLGLGRILNRYNFFIECSFTFHAKTIQRKVIKSMSQKRSKIFIINVISIS